MKFVEILLLVYLVVCALATVLSKQLLTSIITLSCYSVVVSIIWMILQSPDLAITEAAVGAGVTSVLLYITLNKIKALDGKGDEHHE